MRRKPCIDLTDLLILSIICCTAQGDQLFESILSEHRGRRTPGPRVSGDKVARRKDFRALVKIGDDVSAAGKIPDTLGNKKVRCTG